MTPTAVSQVIEQIANIVFSLLFASLWMKYGLAAACAGGTVGTTIGALVAVLYLMVYFSKSKPKKLSRSYFNENIIRYSNKQIFKRLLHYALPLTINWGLQNLGNLVDLQNTKGRLLAAGFSESDADIKYSYLLKYQTLVNVPISLISALCASILPLISGAAALRNREDIKKGILYSYRTALLIAIPSAVGLAVLSEPIFAILFPKYHEGTFLMQYGSMVLVLMAIVQIQSTILQSIGKLYLSTLYILIGIAVKIILNYVLISKPDINILGAIFGSMAGFLLPVLLNNFVIKRTLKIKYNLITLGIKPFISACFMGIVVYLVQFDIEYLLGFVYKGYFNTMISTVASVAAGAFAYLYALILVGGITQGDLQGMPSKVKRLIPEGLLKRIR
jgi:stage V sporulation protein B